ncbi:hypothetical protein LOZ66_003296 [Ophidiomyces ophidiicola]|nr:hypothetical protein LOZ66_003296 [Ophidiomyces ophidiicola]
MRRRSDSPQKRLLRADVPLFDSPSAMRRSVQLSNRSKEPPLPDKKEKHHPFRGPIPADEDDDKKNDKEGWKDKNKGKDGDKGKARKDDDDDDSNKLRSSSSLDFTPKFTKMPINGPTEMPFNGLTEIPINGLTELPINGPTGLPISPPTLITSTTSSLTTTSTPNVIAFPPGAPIFVATSVQAPGIGAPVTTTGDPGTIPSATATPPPAQPDGGISKAGIAAGSVFGGFIVISISFLALLYYKRWQKHRDEEEKKKLKYSAVSGSESGDLPDIDDTQPPFTPLNNMQYPNASSWQSQTPYATDFQTTFLEHKDGSQHESSTNNQPRRSSRYYASLTMSSNSQDHHSFAGDPSPDKLVPQASQLRPISMMEVSQKQNNAEQNRSIQRKSLPAGRVMSPQLPIVAELVAGHPLTPPSIESTPSQPSAHYSNTVDYRTARSSISSTNPLGNGNVSQYSPVSSVSPMDPVLSSPSETGQQQQQQQPPPPLPPTSQSYSHQSLPQHPGINTYSVPPHNG